jgi:hypothetical protein
VHSQGKRERVGEEPATLDAAAIEGEVLRRARRAYEELVVPATSVLTAAPRIPPHGGVVVLVSAVAASMQGAQAERAPTRLWGTAVAVAPNPAHVSEAGAVVAATRPVVGGMERFRLSHGGASTVLMARHRGATETKSGDGRRDRVWFPADKEMAFSAFLLDKGLTANSVERYKAGPRVWFQYLDSLEAQYRPDPVLASVTSLKDKGKFLLDFGLDLYQRRGLRGKQITGLFTHLHAFFDASFDVSITLS